MKKDLKNIAIGDEIKILKPFITIEGCEFEAGEVLTVSHIEEGLGTIFGKNKIITFENDKSALFWENPLFYEDGERPYEIHSKEEDKMSTTNDDLKNVKKGNLVKFKRDVTSVKYLFKKDEILRIKSVEDLSDNPLITYVFGGKGLIVEFEDGRAYGIVCGKSNEDIVLLNDENKENIEVGDLVYIEGSDYSPRIERHVGVVRKVEKQSARIQLFNGYTNSGDSLWGVPFNHLTKIGREC